MTSDDTQQTVANKPVGQQLKQAREKLGLSVSQIADAQHLRNGIIQSIENGEYDQIDSELFLKGYARAYAKQVGLDGDAIIAELNLELEPARLQKERELEANPLVDLERRRRKKRRIAKLFLLVAVAVIVGALVVMFVLPKLGNGEAVADRSAAVESEQQVDANESVDESGMQIATGDGGFNNEPDNVGAVSSDEHAASAPPEELVDDQIPVVAQTTEPALAQPPVSEALNPVAGKLEIVFTGDCWVQVRDASGNRLTSTMKRAGERLEVSGKAPLNVVIGAVNTVKTIRFQGETVDISDFPAVNNRSEFTLTI